MGNTPITDIVRYALVRNLDWGKDEAEDALRDIVTEGRKCCHRLDDGRDAWTYTADITPESHRSVWVCMMCGTVDEDRDPPAEKMARSVSNEPQVLQAARNHGAARHAWAQSYLIARMAPGKTAKDAEAAADEDHIRAVIETEALYFIAKRRLVDADTE